MHVAVSVQFHGFSLCITDSHIVVSLGKLYEITGAIKHWYMSKRICAAGSLKGALIGASHVAVKTDIAEER